MLRFSDTFRSLLSYPIILYDVPTPITHMDYRLLTD